MASVTVQTETGGQPGGSSCLLTSSGAEIQCASGKAGVPDLMRAAGSAGVGSLSIFAAADGPGTFLARADASTSYHYQIVFPGYSGAITGEYAVSISAGIPSGPYGELVLSQGSTKVTLPVENSPRHGPPVMLTSIYAPGQPFEITGDISGDALAPEEAVHASVHLTGFFDPAGNAIPFAAVPEPAGWPVAGLCLGVVLVWGRKE